MMEEHRISEELKKVTSAIPIPEDILPNLKAQTKFHRPVLIAITVILALAMAVTLTPPGRAALKVVTNLVMTINIKRTPPDVIDKVNELIESGAMDQYTAPSWYRKIPINTTEQRTYTNFAGTEIEMTFTDIATATTVDRIDTQEWSLPSYLPPSAGDRVDIVTRTSSTKRPQSDFTYTQLTVTFHVELSGKKYRVMYAVQKYEKVITSVPSTMMFRPDDDVKVVDVKVNGIQATAVQKEVTAGHPTWTMEIKHDKEMILVSTDLPLEELVKVVESLPVVKRVTAG